MSHKLDLSKISRLERLKRVLKIYVDEGQYVKEGHYCSRYYLLCTKPNIKSNCRGKASEIEMLNTKVLGH
jgi:hypothetical protein